MNIHNADLSRKFTQGTVQAHTLCQERRKEGVCTDSSILCKRYNEKDPALPEQAFRRKSCFSCKSLFWFHRRIQLWVIRKEILTCDVLTNHHFCTLCAVKNRTSVEQDDHIGETRPSLLLGELLTKKDGPSNYQKQLSSTNTKWSRSTRVLQWDTKFV